MKISRSMHPDWLSNAYLVSEDEGPHAVVIDTGAPTAPLLAEIRDRGLTVTHIVNTHMHPDHVSGNEEIAAATGAPVVAHPADAPRIGRVAAEVEDGAVIECGSMRLRVIHIPGHTAGQIALVVDESAVFTGDTLFRRSIGGCVGPGHTTFADLRASLMEKLFALPPEMAVYPGHTDATTIGEEWEENPFIRVMRGVDPEGGERCRVRGTEGTVVVMARDYDGGTKAWVRLEGMGDLVVPGSVVERV